MAQAEAIGTLSEFEAAGAEEELDFESDSVVMPLGDMLAMQREHNAPMGGVLEISPSQRQEWESRGKIGYMEQLRRVDKTEMLPFNPESAVKGVKLLRAVNRVHDARTDPEQRARDEELIGNYLFRLEEERTRGFSIGGQISRGQTILPAYMIEFIATGGAAGIGKAAIKEGVKKTAQEVVKRGILKSTLQAGAGLGMLEGAALRTASMPHKIVEGYAERQLHASLEFTDKGVSVTEGVREEPHVSAMKAFGDVFIENFSEATGPAISKGAGYLMPRALKESMERLFIRLHPGETVAKLWTQAGYHGFLEELGEERVGDFLRALTGVEDFGAEDPDSAFDRIVASIPSAEELLVEAGVLSFPGGLRMAHAQAIELIRRRKTDSGELEPEIQVLTDPQIEAIAIKPKEAPEAPPEAPEAAPEAPEDILGVLGRAEEALGEEVLPEDLQARLEEAGLQTGDIEAMTGELGAKLDEGIDPKEAIKSVLIERGVELPEELADALGEAVGQAREREIGLPEEPAAQPALEPGRPAPTVEEPEIPAVQRVLSGLPEGLASDPSIAGNIQNVKALTGTAPIHPTEATPEILRGELTRMIEAGQKPETAIRQRLNQLDLTTGEVVKGFERILLLPESNRKFFRDSLGRDIERRILLTGERPAPEVLAAYEALAGSVGKEVDEPFPSEVTVEAPERPEDLSFPFGENLEQEREAPPDPAVDDPANISAMNTDRFTERFGDLPPEVHRAVLRAGMAAGKPVPEDLGEDAERIAREIEEEIAAEELPPGEKSQALRIVLSAGGLSREEFKEYRGELGNLEAREIVRIKTGISLDSAREVLVAHGLLQQEATVNDVTELLNNEAGKRKAGIPAVSAVREMAEAEYGPRYGGEFDMSPEAAPSDEIPYGFLGNEDASLVQEPSASEGKPYSDPAWYDAYPSELIGYGNAKTIKGEKFGWRTGILSLTPSSINPGFVPKNVRASLKKMDRCPFSSKGCKASCLNLAGRGKFENVQASRVRKTHLYIKNPAVFNEIASSEILRNKFIAKAQKRRLAIRLDGTSDLGMADKLAPKHPDVQFYDYTKNPKRMRRFMAGKMPKNLHLVFSLSEDNGKDAMSFLRKGGSVAVVFSGDLPSEWNGYRVIDATETDLRFADRKIFKIPEGEGFVVGLKATGAAKTVGVKTKFVQKTENTPDSQISETDTAYAHGSPRVIHEDAAARVERLKIPKKARMRKSGIAHALRRDGYVDYRGRTVRNVRQAAEIFATARDGKIEQFQVIFSVKGKVVAHQIYTSGLPDAVAVPLKMKERIRSAANRLNADGIWFAHNHPSGDPKVSSQDVELTVQMARTYGKNMKGHVVTDDKEFSVISHKGAVKRMAFKIPKAKLAPEPLFAQRLTGPEVVANLGRARLEPEAILVAFLDAKLRVIQLDAIFEDADLSKYLRQKSKAYGSSSIVVVKRPRVKVAPHSLPHQVVDVINLEKGHAESYQARGQMEFFKETESDVDRLLAGQSFYRVQEDVVKYAQDEFQALVVEKKIQPGAELTIRRRLDEMTAKRGFVAKGRKVRVVAIDKQNPLFLVEVPGIDPISGDALFITVGPQDLVETYKESPPAPKPAEVAKEVRKVTGLTKPTEEVTLKQYTALKEFLRAQERAARAAQRMTLNEVRDSQSKLITLLEQSKIAPEDRAKFIRKIKNIQTVDQFEQALPEIADRVDALIESSAKRKTLAAIRQELRKVKPRRQAGRLVGKFTATIQDILSRMRAIDKMTQEEAAAKLEENLSANDSGNTVIPGPITSIENKMLYAVAKREDLTASELGEILEIVRALKLGGSQLRKLKQFKEAVDIEEKRDVAKSIIDSRPEDRIKTTADESADDTRWGWYNKATASFLGWDNLMNRLSWADKSTRTNESKLNKLAEVATQETAEKKGQRLMDRKVRRMYTDAFGEMSNWTLTKRWAQESERQDLGTFTNARGEKVKIEMSKAEARKRWMEFQDPALGETLFGENERSMGWTPEMRRVVENFLSPQDLQFAKAQMEFYRGYYAGFNAVFSDINGINLPKNKFYSPIRRQVDERAALENELLGEITHRRSITPSAGKTRVKNLRSLMQINDVEIIQRHVQQVEHYKAWARKIRLLNGVFNDSEIRRAIKANFGSALLRVVDRHIEDFTRGGIDRSSDSATLNIIKNNYTVAVLSGKTAITVKQLMSFPAFADSIPSNDFVAGLVDLGTDTRKKIRILATSQVMRSRGLMITPEMAEAMSSREWAAFQLNPNLRNLLLTMTRWGDRGAIYLGGWSVYRYHREVLGKPHSEAIRAFNDALSSSQQSADLSQTSLFQRGSSWQRMFSVFLSAPNQYFRKELIATEDMVAGRITQTQWIKMMAIYHLILPMMFQFAADGLEWRTKEQIRAGILGSLNGWFIVGQILNNLIATSLGLKPWTSSTILDSLGREGMRLIKTLDPENIDAEYFFEVTKQGVKTAGLVKGLPAPQAINIIEGFAIMQEATTAEEWRRGFKRVAGWSEYVVDQGQKDKKGAF